MEKRLLCLFLVLFSLATQAMDPPTTAKQNPQTLLFIGHTTSGKTSVVNAILNKYLGHHQLLPVGLFNVTSCYFDITLYAHELSTIAVKIKIWPESAEKLTQDYLLWREEQNEKKENAGKDYAGHIMASHFFLVMQHQAWNPFKTGEESKEEILKLFKSLQEDEDEHIITLEKSQLTELREKILHYALGYGDSKTPVPFKIDIQIGLPEHEDLELPLRLIDYRTPNSYEKKSFADFLPQIPLDNVLENQNTTHILVLKHEMNPKSEANQNLLQMFFNERETFHLKRAMVILNTNPVVNFSRIYNGKRPTKDDVAFYGRIYFKQLCENTSLSVIPFVIAMNTSFENAKMVLANPEHPAPTKIFENFPL